MNYLILALFATMILFDVNFIMTLRRHEAAIVELILKHPEMLADEAEE